MNLACAYFCKRNADRQTTELCANAEGWARGATIACFHESAFNYPTLAEARNVAALDGLKKLELAELRARGLTLSALRPS